MSVHPYPESRSEQRSALLVATLTSFMGPFLISSVNVALPTIQEELAVDAVLLSWIATAYLLAMAVVLVPAGKIADIYGRKKIFLWGLSLYTPAAGLSAFVDGIGGFLFLRVFQGAGAAMFVTTGMAILTSVFPPETRGKAIGLYVAAVYIGLSVGPFAGGLLTQHFGWRSIFILVVPMGAASIGVTLKFLTGEWADARGERLDVVGSLLYAISILMLVYGATQIPAPSAPLLMLGGVAGLAGFVWQEVRVTHPVFEVSLFRHNRLFAFSSMAALINYAATFAVTFLMSLYLQYAKGMSPQNAGILLVAQPAVMALFSPLAGRISDRAEPARLASAGMGVCALGLLLFALAGTESSLWRIAANLALLGFGFALFSSPNMSAIMGSVPKRFYGIASGTVATMRLLGQMLSMAVATVTFAVVIGNQPISAANLPSFLTSIRICFGIFTTLCVCGMFFSLRRGALRN